MEGYLDVWSGLLSGWRKCYFILHNDVLTYCAEKGGQKEGSIHLKVASIVQVIDDPLKIRIHTGTSVIYLRTSKVQQRIDWVNALSAAQSESLEQDIDQRVRQLDEHGYYDYQKQTKNRKSLQAITIQIWNAQAELEDLLSHILPKIRGSNTASRMCDKLSKLTHHIKVKAYEAVQILENEQEKMKMPTPPVINEINSNNNIPSSPDHNYNSTANNHRQHSPYQSLIKRKSHGTSILQNVDDGEYDQFKSFDGGRFEEQFSMQRPISQNNTSLFPRSFNTNNSIDQYKSFAQTGNDYSRANDSYRHPRQQNSLYRIDESAVFHSFQEKTGHEYTQNGRNGTHDLRSASKVSSIGKSLTSRNYHPKIELLLSNNQVWVQVGGMISNEPSREHLPFSTTEDMPNVMSVLKDAIGKDLTKISLPVTLNEPLSLLQKGCESLYYSKLLEKAANESDSLKRLTYVMAFAVSQYSTTLNRVRKQFNPLLGETFQYSDPARQFTYFAQQVSHHPPVSATHCQSQYFDYQSTITGQPSFKGASIKVTPSSMTKIMLKRTREVVTFNKCTASINNLLVGKTYNDNYGTVQFKMSAANKRIIGTGMLDFKECGMWGSHQYEVVGWVKDETGVQRYSLSGKWNSELICRPKSANENVQTLWKMNHQSYAQYFNFNDLAINLNHISVDLLQRIAPTDSRLRPDLRAWEHGLKELAASEKHRLEEKQRARRKDNQMKNQQHVILWFDKVYDPETGSEEYVDNKKYWVQRRSGRWSECLDIY